MHPAATVPAVQVLVVHAHPSRASFSRALCDVTVNALERAGHEVNAVSLYDEDFDPRMTAEERIAYHTDQPIVSGHVADHADLVRAAEALVFVFPTWWFGLPAMLKGWLDRVLVPGVAFDFDDAGRVVPAMQHVRRIVAITTYGASRWRVAVMNDAGRRTLLRALRVACGRRTRRTWIGLYRMDAAGERRRTAFLDRVDKRMGRL